MPSWASNHFHPNHWSIHLKKIALCAALAACSSFVFAAPPKALEEGVANGQLTILKEFPAASGLTGWVVAPTAKGAGPAGKPLVMYTTADGKTLITGMPVLVDEAGRNLSAVYDELHVPKPDFSATYDKLKTAKTLNLGKQGEKPVFVFFDANCVYCHFLSKAAMPYIDAGADVRFVPVAFLKQDSAGKAAALFAAQDPRAAILENDAKFRAGGIAAVEVSPEIRAALDANSAMMAEIGATGTPAVLYRDAEGKTRMIGGMPKLAQLPAIFGLPEIPNSDPDLARFR